MEKNISIILVNYNGANDTIKCIKSLSKIEYDNYKIIIVDNCSTDNSVEIIRNSLYEKCILIESKYNRGFSSGNNIGINEAIKLGTDYILLLNNDTEVEPDFINKMIETYEQTENVGIVTCKMKYFDNKEYIWFGGGYFNEKNLRINHEKFRLKDNFNDKIREITFATGCCMLMSTKIIKEVGLLSEDYFMYFEDADYCIRVMEKKYKIIYNPEATIYHKVGAASGGEESELYLKWMTRNQLIFNNKFKYKISNLGYMKVTLNVYIKSILKSIIYLIKGKIKKSIAIISGLIEGKKYINARH